MMDGAGVGWREVDRELRRVAKARAVVDAEELRWLAVAQEVELHDQLGMATMLEYVERVLGYGPKAGHERLRVARELVALPKCAAALAEGRLAFSAVRELTRKVTAETEEEWLETTRGMCLREIEERLSGYKKGDRPGDTPDPDLHVHKLVLELTPPTMALYRDTCRRMETEHGHRMTDDEIVVALCAGRVEGSSRRGDATAEQPSPRGDEPEASEVAQPRAAAPRLAPYQIALTVCPSCDRGWHDAAGRAIPVPDSTIAQALCDAQYIGRTDLGVPERSEQEIPPAVARLVLRRDRGCCAVPGCRSARWIQIHHIQPREHGGSNEPWNLICLCFAHHQALHQAKISVTGTAPHAVVFDLAGLHPPDAELVVNHTAGPRPSNIVVTREPVVQAPRAEPPSEDNSALAQQALVRLGFRPGEARAAIDRARLHVETANLEALVLRSLHELAPPRTGVPRAPS